jgi:hypothetical protein
MLKWETWLFAGFFCQFRFGGFGLVDTNPLPIEPLPIVHIATHGVHGFRVAVPCWRFAAG